MSEAKAISCCGDCIYYNYKRHRCMRGCSDEGEATDSFYRDCPLPPATITKQGAWKIRENRGAGTVEAECPFCGREAVYQPVDGKWEYENFCPHCGAKLREVIVLYE